MQFNLSRFTIHLFYDKLYSIKPIILFAALLLPYNAFKAQQPNLQLIARPLPDSILLRWAPVNYQTWQSGNQYGYKLIRYTLIRNGTLLNKPEKTELNLMAIKPYELNNWEELVKVNKYAAIAAQAIYGKTFEIDAGKGFNPQNVYYISKEQQQRYSFTLFAADMSPRVALASGLWFTDKSVQKDEKYLYKVFIDWPDSLNAGNDTAFVFTGIPEYMPLPSPVEFNAEFDNKLAKLSWNILAQNNIYISWEIERSADKGRNFKSVSPDAIVPFFEGNAELSEFNFKFDSLPENGIEYQYRLRGISSFGEPGPWSAIVKGKGIESISAGVNISGHTFEKKSIIIKWEFPDNMEANISGFKVLRSDRHDRDFVDISGKIKQNKREFMDKKPLETAYYKVMVFRDTIANKMSYPYLVQQVDSIPPHRPVGLTGISDTSGIIKLSWKPNIDKDIYGYKVFRSNSGKDEYLLLTITPVSDLFYTDTINKQDLNRSVFYKIAAVDNRQNQSEISQTIQVLKPDVTAPSAPVISETIPIEAGIILKWINSTSPDVIRHEVYRQIVNENEWIKIDGISIKKVENTSSFTDSEYPAGQIVRYKIIAIDKNGNQSAASVSVDIKGLITTNVFELKKLQKQVYPGLGKVLVSWEKPPKQVIQYKIYQMNKNGKYELYQTIAGESASFEFENIKIGGLYAFRIKAYFDDRSISPFSKEIIVQL